MAVDQQETRLVQKSIVRHLIGTSLVGWTTPTNWVKIGFLYENPSTPPAVSVPVPEGLGDSFELGSTTLWETYLVDIDCRANSNTQLSDLMDSIGKALTGIRIINFNTAEPHEGGYDESAQTVARFPHATNIRKRVLDPQESEGRISCQLRPSGPF